ncbi:MAG: DUF5683 domain-containing protein [Bacteroidota bacterium]
MYRLLILFFLINVAVFEARSQVQPATAKPDSLVVDTIKSQRADTTKPKYINLGKIAGRRAAISSAIVPGLGQIRNGVTLYRMAKVAAIYTGATLLTLSYFDNDKNYKIFLNELTARREGTADPNSVYASYPETGLLAAKDTFRRNREVVIFSLAGLYLLNIVEAYVDARLKYFDVGDVAFKVSPGLMNNNGMYGFNSLAPGLKITLSL